MGTRRVRRLNPLYIIWEDADGRHGGSMRIMPTVGRTMTNEHFLHLTDGVRIASPLIWECTRFCLAPGASAERRGGAARGRGRARPALRPRAGARRGLRRRPCRSTAGSARSPTSSAAAARAATRISVGLWDDHRGAARGDLPPLRHPAVGDRPLVRRELRRPAPLESASPPDGWPRPPGAARKRASGRRAANGALGGSGAGLDPHRGDAARLRGRPAGGRAPARGRAAADAGGARAGPGRARRCCSRRWCKALIAAGVETVSADYESRRTPHAADAGGAGADQQGGERAARPRRAGHHDPPHPLHARSTTPTTRRSPSG